MDLLKKFRIPNYLVLLLLISGTFLYLFFFSPTTSTRKIDEGVVLLNEKYSFVEWNVSGGGYLSEIHVYFNISEKNKTVMFLFLQLLNDDFFVTNFKLYFQDELELYLKGVGDLFQVRLICLNGNTTIHYLIEFLPGSKYWSFLGLMFFGSITLIAIPVVKLTDYLEKTRG